MMQDVPDAGKDELAARAALPSVEKVLERIRERKGMAGTRLLPEEILAHRDADRQ